MRCVYLSTAPTVSSCTLRCLNGGSCFLNERNQPKCKCQPRYTGEKCETDQCREYCQNGGTCTASPSGMPTCRCPNGYTGPDCRQMVCDGYCRNGASCNVNSGNQPNCRCPPGIDGERCQYRKCTDYCLHLGKCRLTELETKECVCPSRYEGIRCEIDKCDRCKGGPCTVQSSGAVICNCTNGKVAPSCLTCEDYCRNNGDCEIDQRSDLPSCRCVAGWTGSRCEQRESDSAVGSKTTSIIIPIIILLLLLILLVIIGVYWYRKRSQGAKGFQHQRMTNGMMNVEIGNPTYNMYEAEPDDGAGELLDSDFNLDPDKPTNFTNPVYATLYMGAHSSRNSLTSTDEKKELLSAAGDDELADPLA
ncbi:low-density lipoprotein receptor-related protein 1-like [Hypanus sabinus]|uniref:low-density lipoprotein receptor-related protein 1-like n=1 Tax=Hypanus sabinus TaxID=79690 RepID=UPI0028C47C75|nr:low-density lipoprotein receptor-related protein 1-like [Hypanus sabinus]